MGCFSCLYHHQQQPPRRDTGTTTSSSFNYNKSKIDVAPPPPSTSPDSTRANEKQKSVRCGKGKGARGFSFRELASATSNFREMNLIGEGGFGKVYKGRLESGQIVAVKQLNHHGHQGYQEFVTEVLMLSLLHHPNLVTLIGYCTAGDERLLVYDYMPMGSLEHHLFDLHPHQQPLSWTTRMKIAVGAAQGLQYLHCNADPPVIYRDLKSANILLDLEFNPKLSDFGLAKLGPVGGKTHVSTRVMGTYGYCAPEYAMSGKLTLRSDIYSFGVVLLELITAQKAIDHTKRPGQQNLVAWSRPFLKDQKKFSQLVDPLLEGRYPRRCLNYAIAITAMCLNEEAHFRPLIGDVVVALEYLYSQCLVHESNHASLQATTPSSPTPT